MDTLRLALALDYPPHFRLRIAADLPARGITAVYGPSGSGKTSLLNCIAGLAPAGTSGTVALGDTVWQGAGTFLPAWQRAVGYVFQQARLLPHLNVRGNLLYGAQRRHGGDLSLAQVSAWLGLDELLERPVNELSGGQQQRVAIGRALLAAPDVLLLDEPLSGLDGVARRTLIGHLQRLRRELDLPVIYVSHDIEEVTRLADHVVLLRDGAIEAQGSLLELCSRLDTSLSHAQQAGAVLLGRVRAHDNEYALSELDVDGRTLFVSRLAAAPGETCRVRIPARDVSVSRERPAASSILNSLPVELAEIEETTDSRVLLKLRLQQQHLLARITRRSREQLALRVGEPLYAQVKSVALLSEPG
jgi:molybdate transport system ATP-binding protein